MNPIPIQSIQNVSDDKSFLQFLQQELNWPLPADLAFEDLTYDWFPSDIGLKPEQLRGSSILQLKPMAQDQPWGIFIIKLQSSQLYITELRTIIRALRPLKRGAKGHKTFPHEHLLFICTPDWKNYTFAHFEGKESERPRLSTFGWEYQSSYLRTICEFNLTALRMPEADLMGIAPTAWLQQWSKAFEIKSVTDQFYDELKKVFNEVQQFVSGILEEEKRAFTQLIINRLLFLKFLERKGWLFVNETDTISERHQYLSRQRQRWGEQNQWDQFFYHLFFKGLNRISVAGTYELTDAISDMIGHVPYLNGGLFEKSKTWNDKAVKVDNRLFDIIFERLLNRYNFTIQENTPFDVEVALNPDLLGYAYEELIAERHGQGAFYTHPVEVELMCKESLKTYLEEHTNIDREAIARLIDIPNSDKLSEEEALTIYKILYHVKILDLAIGSGAYPVRMMQILVGIYEKLADKLSSGSFGMVFGSKLNSAPSKYQLKLTIIENNLYGADIDQFAVEIAKLRFWLSLVVDFDQPVNTPNDLDKIPALPNLDFKLRIGDSLVATPGKVTVTTRRQTRESKILNLDTHFNIETLDAFYDDHVKELKALKDTYFNFEQVRKERPEMLCQSKDDLRKQIADIEDNLAKAIGFSLQKKHAEEINHILWQIHFAEIFSRQQQGFDIIIANPPYLRQEKINELFDNFKMGITKDDLVKAYEELYADQDLKINKQSDLYVYFYLRGVNLLKDKGVLCFICSNSWLDVGYGKGLQEFLLRNTRVKSVFDSAKRSFEKADVNTTINVFIKDKSVSTTVTDKKKKTERIEITADHIARFVNFRKSFEESATSQNLQNLYKTDSIVSNDDYRVYPIKQKDLWQNGLEIDEDTGETSYEGDKWGGKYLRAPDIFFTILEKGKDKLVRLGDIAEIHGYIHDNNVKPHFSKVKIVLSSQSINKILILDTDNNVVLDGVNPNGNSRLIPDLVVGRTFNERFIVNYNKGKILFKRFYKIVLKNDKLVQNSALLLNSSIQILFWETEGVAEGLGALNIYERELERLHLVNPSLIKINLSKVNNIFKREIKSIFTELGFDPSIPIREQEPNPLLDRKALDDIIFDALGLTAAERKEVYYAVCELVQNRLNKAKSV